MTKLTYRSKRASVTPEQIRNLPKLYFSCHPDDFAESFDAVCADIFKTHDCLIFYKEDMADALPSDTWEVDLDRMNVFVFPVTFRLLTDHGLPVYDDLAFAAERKKPVLPIVFDHLSSADSQSAQQNTLQQFVELYGSPELFGTRQYLEKYSTNPTEISYAEKLRKYLDVTLLSSKTIDRIRKAFDAYIFLSYRKKDRKYANDLMRLIHQIPQFRDIAVWFDEFLVPGESFEESIRKALHDSRFVTLLVTPSLLESDASGAPNYVQRIEYPMARDSGKTVLPAKSRDSGTLDEQKLYESYAGLQKIIDFEDNSIFSEAFSAALGDALNRQNDSNPEHLFLIGLAYLEGIDVERNLEYGTDLITKAAEAELPEAMEKLYEMYRSGNSVKADDQKALFWIQKLYQYDAEHLGKENETTLNTLLLVAYAYFSIRDFGSSLRLSQECYEGTCRVYGKEHPYTLNALSSIGNSYGQCGNHLKAIELLSQCFAEKCRVLGEVHRSTLSTLNSLASHYRWLKRYDEMLSTRRKAYEIAGKLYSEDSQEILYFIEALASAYGTVGAYEEQLEFRRKSYELRCKLFGDSAKDTMDARTELAEAYGMLGDTKQKNELLKLSCEICRREYGEGREYLAAQIIMAKQQEPEKQLTMLQNCYALSCEKLGDNDGLSLRMMIELADCYRKMKQSDRELELLQSVYDIGSRTLGEEHALTMKAMEELSWKGSQVLGDEAEREMRQKYYEVCQRKYGDSDRHTLSALLRLAKSYSGFRPETELKLIQKYYDDTCQAFGKENIKTLDALQELASAYGRFKDCERQLHLLEECLSIKIRVYGEDSNDICYLYHKISCLYIRPFKRPDIAAEYREKEFAVTKRIHGEESGKTIDVLSSLIMLYKKAHNRSKQLAALEAYCGLLCRTCGEEHPDTVKAQERLEALRSEQNTGTTEQ